MPEEDSHKGDAADPAPKQHTPPPPASSEESVLYSLSPEIRPPSVVLDDSIVQGGEPILQPTSTEMPKTIESSRYQLQGEIARGGMGAVLKGRDVDLGRNLAIKVLLDEHKENPVVIQRFIEEAQIGGQLQHPGIAPVYELGQFEDQRPFFTMKLVKGETLAYMLAGRYSLTHNRGKLLGIFKQVCQTMAYAHSRRVIHRDLKPANIMVGAFGEVQVMDWGLAKVLPADGQPATKPVTKPDDGKSIIATFRSPGSDVPLPNVGSVEPIGSDTQMGSAMGTPAYMPPEQALGEVDRMDRRSDVFGLGAILCEILTGQPPYIADDLASMMRLACRGKTDECFERLDQSDTDEQLIRLTKRCLEFELDDRPRDAAEVSGCITQYLESVESQIKEAEIRRAEEEARSTEERKRRKVAWGLAASVLVTIGLGAGGWMWNGRQVAQRQQTAQQQFDQSFNDARLHQKLADNENLAVRKSELEIAIKNTQSAIKLADELKLPGDRSEPAEEFKNQLESELAKTTEAISAQDRNQRLADQLELIRVSQVTVGNRNESADENTRGNFQQAFRRYQSTFAEAGFDLTKRSDDQLVQLISNSPIRSNLVTSLDHWISCFPPRSVDDQVQSSLSIGDWERAAELSRQLLEAEPTNSKHWLKLAPSLVLSGQKEEYKRLCRRMCDQFVSSESINDADRVVKICLLLPGAIELTEIPTEVLEDGVDESKIPVGWHWASRALLEYRRGKPKEAYKWILEVEAAGPGPLASSYIASVKSLIEWELGEKKKAMASLKSAEGMLHQILDNVAQRSSLDAGFALIHFREAQERLSVTEPDSRIEQFVSDGLEPSKHPEILRRLAFRERLRRLVQQADDNSFRRDVRQTVVDSDPKRLLDLASSEEAKRQTDAFTAWLGAALRRSDQVDTAITLLKASQQDAPSDVPLNLELSQCFQAKGNADEALNYARAAYAARPASEATQWLLMITLADADHNTESERLFARMMQRSELSADQLVKLAARLNSQGQRHSQAKIALENALQVDPQNALAFQVLCRTMWQMSEPESALEAGLKAFELAPDDWKTHWELGNVYQYGLKDFEKSVEHYSRAAEISPRSSDTYFQLAFALETAGQRRVDGCASSIGAAQPRKRRARQTLAGRLMAKGLSGPGGDGKALDQGIANSGNQRGCSSTG